jgi:hypothetical protein
MGHYFLKFFFYISLLITTILFTYLIYKIQLNFFNISSAYRFYVFAFFFFFFSFIIFYYLKLELNITLFIFIFSFTITVYAFEIYINIDKTNKYKIFETRTGEKYDKRTKFEIYNDLKKDKNIRPGTYPVQFLEEELSLFPLSTFSSKKIIYCNENGYYSIYNSDRFGFNNLDKIWDSEIIDYLLIGDSFTNGACVNSNDNIAGNLSKLTQSQSILNLGMGGAGPITEYAILKEYAPKEKKINRILWLYYEGNDLGNIQDEYKNNILKNYLGNENYSQNLNRRRNEINNFLESKLKSEEIKAIKDLNDKKKKYFFSIIKLSKTRQLFDTKINIIFNSKKDLENISNINYEEMENIFNKIIINAQKYAIDKKSNIYFVYIPDSKRYIGVNKTAEYHNYDKVIKLVKELNIPIIDIHKNFIKLEYSPLKFYSFETVGNHFNEDGYKKVSEIIFAEINKFEVK